MAIKLPVAAYFVSHAYTDAREYSGIFLPKAPCKRSTSA